MIKTWSKKQNDSPRVISYWVKKQYTPSPVYLWDCFKLKVYYVSKKLLDTFAKVYFTRILQLSSQNIITFRQMKKYQTIWLKSYG